MDGVQTYRLLRLIESNFKRIRALDITPARHVNKICAKNRQGKTSCLDGIEAALGGAKHFPTRPVQTGSEQADIVCVLGDTKPELLVKRVIQENGKTALEITSAEGFKAPTPQAILDGLYSKLAFNPHAFLFMDSKAQVEMLRKMVGLDFTQLDKQRQALYDARTQSNKDAKSYRAQADGTKFPDDTPEEEVSNMQLMVELKRRQEFNKKNQGERTRIQKMEFDVATAKNGVVQLEKSVADLEVQLLAKKRELGSAMIAVEQAVAMRDAQQSTINVLQDQDVEEVQNQIVAAQTINANVAKRKRKEELLRNAGVAEQGSDGLTEQIKALDAQKAKQLSEAKWPVEGLSFGDGEVLYKDLPFGNASGAEQLEVSFAMGAAMSPRLKIALIRNASLLDDEQMDVVCKMAEKLDMQVFLEVVGDESGPATVVIEDGLVTEGGTPTDAPAIAKPKRTRTKQADEAAELTAQDIPFDADERSLDDDQQEFGF